MKLGWSSDNPMRLHSAFALAEVMVAVALVTLTAVGLYGGLSTGLQLVRVSGQNLRATEILEGRLEAMRLYSWQQIAATNGIPTSFEAEIDPSTTANGRVIIDAPGLNTTYAPDIRRVQIELAWKSHGKEHIRSMSTFVARYGMQNRN